MSASDVTAAVGETVEPASRRDSGGLVALALVCGFHRIAVQPAQLRHDLGLEGRVETAEDIVRAAGRVGLKARIVRRGQPKRIIMMPMPAIIELTDGSFAVVATRTGENSFRVVDPLSRQVREESSEAISASSSGRVVLIARRVSANDPSSAFGLGWFLPSLARYRGPLALTLVASLFIQLCGLITPLFFQITIDKVLVHRGYSTLTMIVAGLLLLGVFNVLLQYLRSYLLSHTTSRIDVELGARLFNHLLRLPLTYFERRPTGQTVARVRELETIRSFLTGQGLTSAIDCLFTFVFIAVLALYSPFLTLIVIASIPFYVVIAIVLRPILRDKTNERFNRGAATQQFLVESVVGIQTIKASAIEPQLASQWEDRLAAYVKSSFNGGMVAALGQNVIQYVNKVTTALVLFFGALAVIQNELTVGGLIAFNMIMNQATAPILRLSQLWQDFQQMQISVERIGDILNAPAEVRSLALAHLPPAEGAISLEDVTFRYGPGMPEALSNVSIQIAAGQVLGVVGPSGSGKSTFTKLLQRLYVPESGQVMVDNVDVSQVDPAWLRRQIGVVLQENLLFNRSVHENIALANPGMSRAQVMALAKLAGADEFISRLPLGYDTVIEERGVNLSGGQRQRLAIARALALNPRILILDEATSALDYESERIIQQNMKHIVKGRTVIVIAHRLAAVRDCDRIIAFDQGRLVEDGTHAELVSQPTSMYGRLWRLQSAGVEESVP